MFIFFGTHNVVDLANEQKSETMKAKIETKRKSRVLTTVIVLTLATTMVSAQGFLAEGAVKLFDALIKKDRVENNVFSYTGYATDASSGNTAYHASDATPVVLESFSVSNVEVVFEEELATETWMTEPISKSFESSNVEAWMTHSFAEELEPNVELEAWMTQPFVDADYEAELEVEEWMTNPLLDASNETEIEVEDWMTQPLVETAVEEELVVETWMTVPLLNDSEETTPEVEGWMTSVFK